MLQNKMWAVNPKAKWGVFVLSICLVLAAVSFLGCDNTRRNPPQMDHSGIGITATFPLWSSDHSKAQVVLTFSNLTAQSRTVVLPCPLKENATCFASSDKPTLVLAAKELLSQNEEGFFLTDWRNGTSGQSKVLTLKPGESIEVPYALASFYLWGHAGPRESDGFLSCLRPGEREVAIRALMAYSDIEPGRGEHIESPPVVLQCAFPEWLFRATREGATEPPPENEKDSTK